MLAKILGGMAPSADSPFRWPVIFGANLGGSISPIDRLAPAALYVLFVLG